MRFSWWGTDTRHQATLAAMDLYKRNNPNITIEGEYQGFDGFRQKLMTQFAGGTAPDIIQYDYMWLADVTAMNAMVDFSRENINIEMFPKQVLENFCGLNGQVIGLPMSAQGTGTIIIKSFFEKFSLPINEQITWEWILETGARIHRQDPNSYLLAIDMDSGILGDCWFNPYIYARTGEYWTNDKTKTIDVPRQIFVEVFSLLNQLVSSGAMLSLEESSLYSWTITEHPKLINNQIGIVVNGASFIPRIESLQPKDNLYIGRPPLPEKRVSDLQYFKPGLLLGANDKSVHRAEAVKFVDWFLTSNEAGLILKDTRGTPVASGPLAALEEQKLLNPNMSKVVNYSLSNTAPPYPLANYDSQIMEIMGETTQAVGFGTMTPEQAADQFIRLATERLNALKRE
jgi:oligogalacturonide transport system substrate-binding protein